MISKRSFIKLMKDDIWKRGWLWVIAVLLFCLVLPGITLDGIQAASELKTAEEVMTYYLKVAAKNQNPYFLYGTIGLAAVCALSSFAYLHSRNKLDFYHSLPVTREGWMTLQYGSSLLIFAVTAGISFVEEIFIGLFYQMFDSRMLLIAGGSYGIYLLIFLFSYSIFVTAMLLTGKIVVSFFVMAAIFGFTSLLAWIYEMFQYTFYSTYYEGQSSSEFWKYPSPLTFLTELTEGWGDFAVSGMQSDFPRIYILSMILVIMSFWLLNRSLYRGRRTEAAGSAIVFPKIAGLIEILVVVTASLGVGICLKNFSYTQSDLWFFGGMALGILIFTALVDFVYSMDVHGIFRKYTQMAVITVLTFGISLIFRFDLLGYDTYLPARDEISSMSVESYELSSVQEQRFYTSLTESSSMAYYGGRLDQYQMTEFDPIYRMAENGCENAQMKNVQQEDLIYANIRYDLVSGQSIYRSYWLDKDVYEENAARLYEKSGFVKAMYPVFNRNYRQLESIMGNSVENDSSYIVFSSEEAKRTFTETYQSELITLKYEELYSADMIGSLSLSYDTEESSYGRVSWEDYGYPVLRRFTKTIAYLETLGIVFNEHLDPKEVHSLEIWDMANNQTWNLLSLEAGKADWITESEKQELIEMLTYRYCMGYNLEDAVYLITAYGEDDEYLQSFQVPYEDLPEGIQRIVSRSNKKQ